MRPVIQAANVGAPGLGDTHFPNAGNSGYDVAHYLVELRYRPISQPGNRSGGAARTSRASSGRSSTASTSNAAAQAGHITAAVTVTATARQDLTAFNLDFRGPRVTAITVDGVAAQATRAGQELTVRPARALRRGQRFTAVVRYAGRPEPLRHPQLGTYGWVPTRDGVITQSEPDGTPTWMPVNDHPLDKATYTFRITVPRRLRVVANGEPRPPVTRGAATTYEWVERFPMASYLAMVAIGRFVVRQTKLGNTPIITAADPRYARAAARLEKTTVRALRWISGVLGGYPFATAGGVIDDPQLGYALENQERPVYSGFVPDDTFIVHELAHQWFGNSVSLTRWRDIWLNEAFATYAEWLWQEHRKQRTAKETFRRYYRKSGSSTIFNPPPATPGQAQLFGTSVYVRGAMTLHALRERVGDRAFFRILRDWVTQHRDRHGTMPEFVALAERVSGRQLDRLFQVWLFQKGKPTDW